MKTNILIFSTFVLASCLSVAAPKRNDTILRVKCKHSLAYTAKTPNRNWGFEWPVSLYEEEKVLELRGTRESQTIEFEQDIPNTAYRSSFYVNRVIVLDPSQPRDEHLNLGFTTWEKNSDGSERFVTEDSTGSREKSEGKIFAEAFEVNPDLYNTIAKLGYSAKQASRIPTGPGGVFKTLVDSDRIPNSMLYYQGFSCSY